jgi:O-methyltransferase
MIPKFLKNKIKAKLNNYIHDNFIQFKKADAETFENWIYNWMYFQNFEYVKKYTPKNTYYEFGTGWGGTLSGFLRACNRLVQDHKFDISQIKIVLFDSFEGLPEEKDPSDFNPVWKKGEFAYSKDYITEIIKSHNFPIENVTFIEGYFENSLNNETFEILKKLPEPSIITMDVDYYSSTKIALDFIRPFLKSGSVFYFDDLYSFHLHPRMGQIRAINEFNNEDKGTLNPLVHMNYCGRGFIFTNKVWEYSNHE